MSKKIIKLTENQVKKIIGKLVSEQTTNQPQGQQPNNQPQGPQATYKHTQTGQVYRLPLIKSDSDVSRFINFGGSGINQKADLLASMGLDLRDMAKKENEGIKQGKKPGETTQFLYILNSINSFLDVVAQFNIPSKSVRAMSNQIIEKMDQRDMNKNYKYYLPIIFSPDNTAISMDTYWNSLGKLSEYQKNQITSS